MGERCQALFPGRVAGLVEPGGGWLQVIFQEVLSEELAACQDSVWLAILTRAAVPSEQSPCGF